MTWHAEEQDNGFTLAEVMIASVASTLLLAGLWAMLTIYTRFLEKGQDQAHRLQLVRAVQQQLSDDLRALRFVEEKRTQESLIPAGSGSRGSLTLDSVDERTRPASSDFGSATRESPDAFEPMASTSQPARLPPKSALRPKSALTAAAPSSSLPAKSLTDSPAPIDEGATDNSFTWAELPWDSPQVGLIGTATSLVLDTMASLGIGDVDQGPSSSEPNTSSRVPELRRIIYTFCSDFEAKRTGQPAGLVRYEIPWERVLQLPSHASNVSTRSPATRFKGGATQASFESPVGALSGQAPPPDLMAALTTDGDGYEHVPELVAFEIRYFDGLAWHSSWDSRQQNSLPVAMDIRFELAMGEVTQADDAVPQAESEVLDSVEPSSATEPDVPLRDPQPDMTSNLEATSATDSGANLEIGGPGATSRLLVFLHPSDQVNTGMESLATPLPRDIP